MIDGLIQCNTLRFRYFERAAEWSFSPDYNSGNPLYQGDIFVTHSFSSGQARRLPRRASH